jgi:hypothetical protein
MILFTVCKASVATVVKCTYCRLERETEVRKRPRPKSGQVSLRLLGGVSRRYLLVMQAAGEVHGGRWSVSPVFSLVGLLRFVFVRLFAREAAKAELVIAKEEGPEGAVTVVAMVLFHEIRNPAYSIFNKRPPAHSWPYRFRTVRHPFPIRELFAASFAPHRNRLSQFIPPERSQSFSAAGRHGASSFRSRAPAVETETATKKRTAAVFFIGRSAIV